MINLLYFAWELMWPEPKFTGLRSLGFSQTEHFYIPIGCCQTASLLITIKLISTLNSRR